MLVDIDARTEPIVGTTSVEGWSTGTAITPDMTSRLADEAAAVHAVMQHPVASGCRVRFDVDLGEHAGTLLNALRAGGVVRRERRRVSRRSKPEFGYVVGDVEFSPHAVRSLESCGLMHWIDGGFVVARGPG